MALFRRNKEQDVLPDEVKDYYKAEQRERMGMAWLVAAGGFLVTIAIVLGLFFAGRWAYTTFFSDDTTTPISEVEETDANEDELPSTTDTTDQNANDEDQPTDQQDQNDDAIVDEQPSERTVDDDTELPRTGPVAE